MVDRLSFVAVARVVGPFPSEFMVTAGVMSELRSVPQSECWTIPLAGRPGAILAGGGDAMAVTHPSWDAIPVGYQLHFGRWVASSFPP